MKARALITAVLLGVASVAIAGIDTSTDKNSVILNGYDAVAYFTVGAPTKGSEKYTATHDGAIYRFSSSKNRDTFVKNPSKYAPVYGGYCAYGTSVGKKFAVNGKAFEVVSGRLYVNKDEGVYKTWKKDISGNIKKAEKNWPGIKNKRPEDL